MDYTWSLDSLYKGFDDPNFVADLKKASAFPEMSQTWVADHLDKETEATVVIESYITMITDINITLRRLGAFASLSFSTNTRNAKALGILDQVQKVSSNLASAEVRFEKWLVAQGNVTELAKNSAVIKEHEFFLSSIIDEAKYQLSEREEVLIAKLSSTGSGSWSVLQNKISSQLLVDIEIDGEMKQLPLSTVRNMAFDSNPDIRKKAFHAELAAYKKQDKVSAACLNGIKGEALTIAEMRGYDSPLDMTVQNSRMTHKTLNAMLDAMRDRLPMFRKYLKTKAHLLGHEKGLPIYDLNAPMGNATKKYSVEDAMALVVDNFASFSKELGDYAQKAFDQQWIDFLPREGKRGGAFCSNLPFIKESRILTNFTGDLKNVVTIAHELGHGFHGANLCDESILNTSYPMPLAETASIFCETIVKSAILKDADEELKFTVLDTTLTGSTGVIVDIMSRYIFETNLFKTREDHNLSVEEINELMIAAQKEAYGDGLDHDCLHPYMWMNKPHYYMPSRHFYNFPYAFGLLFAKGLYAEYLKRGEAFIGEYNALLNATGKMKIVEVCQLMNIDVESSEFWHSSLDMIEEEINAYIELSKNR